MLLRIIHMLKASSRYFKHTKLAKCIKMTCILLFLDSEFKLPQGVYLFLGYSIKDEKLLKTVTQKGIRDSLADINGLVYHYNINNNKVRCLA